jgi:DNA-binding transcriptional ArsR family regulator
MVQAAPHSDAFRAVADPTRRRILDLLAVRERTVGDLVAELGISQPSVSQQVARLREAGLVEQRRDGRSKVCFVTPVGLTEVFDWVRHYERFWNERLDALGDVLDDVAPHTPGKASSGKDTP